MTLQQIKKFKEAGKKSIKIEPEKLLNSEMAFQDYVNILDVNEAQEILFYSSAEADEVERAQNIGNGKVSKLLEALMGDLAVKALHLGYKRIIVAGGETSGAVTKKIGYTAFFIGRSIAPGVPIMIPVEQPEMRLVLKSGNFGKEDFFLEAEKITRG